MQNLSLKKFQLKFIVSENVQLFSTTIILSLLRIIRLNARSRLFDFNHANNLGKSDFDLWEEDLGHQCITISFGGLFYKELAFVFQNVFYIHYQGK